MGRTSGGGGGGGGGGSSAARRGAAGGAGAVDRQLLGEVSRRSTLAEGREAERLAESMPRTSRWYGDYVAAGMAGASIVNAVRYADARRAARGAVMRAKFDGARR